MFRRVVHHDESPCGVDGVGGEVELPAVDAVPGRKGRVEGEKSQLRVSIVRGKRAGQRLGGKDTCADNRVARKWFLVVRIDRSAGLVRCWKGGTCWKETFSEWRKAVRVAEVSLSKIRCEMGKELDEKNSNIFLRAET